jgi:hypothetical protein
MPKKDCQSRKFILWYDTAILLKVTLELFIMVALSVNAIIIQLNGSTRVNEWFVLLDHQICKINNLNTTATYSYVIIEEERSNNNRKN